MACLSMETPKKLREEKEYSYIKQYYLEHVLSQGHSSAHRGFWWEMEWQSTSSWALALLLSTTGWVPAIPIKSY